MTSTVMFALCFWLAEHDAWFRCAIAYYTAKLASLTSEKSC